MQRTDARLHIWYQENNNCIHTNTKPLLAATRYVPFLDFSLSKSKTTKVSLLNKAIRNEGNNSKTFQRISATSNQSQNYPCTECINRINLLSAIKQQTRPTACTVEKIHQLLVSVLHIIRKAEMQRVIQHMQRVVLP
jgi:hypothetical protein